MNTTYLRRKDFSLLTPPPPLNEATDSALQYKWCQFPRLPPSLTPFVRSVDSVTRRE